jgi:hypothetical protein
MIYDKLTSEHVNSLHELLKMLRRLRVVCLAHTHVGRASGMTVVHNRYRLTGITFSPGIWKTAEDHFADLSRETTFYYDYEFGWSSESEENN